LEKNSTFDTLFGGVLSHFFFFLFSLLLCRPENDGKLTFLFLLKARSLFLAFFFFLLFIQPNFSPLFPLSERRTMFPPFGFFFFFLGRVTLVFFRRRKKTSFSFLFS